jgi:hypothetical protein
VLNTFKNDIAAFDLRREKVESNGWEEKKYEVSDNWPHYTDHDPLMQPIGMLLTSERRNKTPRAIFNP